MYAILSSLKNLIKISEVVTDNFVFRLHYRLSVIILVAFSIVVSTNQFFGDPIDCVGSLSNNDVPQKVLDNFCWIHSTFTLPSAYNKRVGIDVPFHGIDKARPQDEKTYHAYYQWVCFFLFLQAVLFYIPRFLWKSMEGGKIKQILLGLSDPIVMDPKDKTNKVAQLAEYLNETLRHHKVYGLGFAACEILNFVNVVGAIYFTNTFLGGEFTTYGTEVIKFSQMDQQNRTDPMIQIFPRMTKCTFRRFGPSGDIQNFDALCILPINIINEKIFIFLWFYYIILSVISGLILIYRLALLISKKLRWLVTSNLNRYANRSVLQKYVYGSSYGDWFLMQQLCKNMDSLHFRDLIAEMDELLAAGADSVMNVKRSLLSPPGNSGAKGDSCTLPMKSC